MKAHSSCRALTLQPARWWRATRGSIIAVAGVAVGGGDNDISGGDVGGGNVGSGGDVAGGNVGSGGDVGGGNIGSGGHVCGGSDWDGGDVISDTFKLSKFISIAKLISLSHEWKTICIYL